ncbi:unnamed protein product, partial [Discosporangium mesarthrocarpum]
IFPVDLWGSRQNLRVLLKAVGCFVQLKRHEKISIKEVRQGMSTNSFLWMSFPAPGRDKMATSGGGPTVHGQGQGSTHQEGMSRTAFISSRRNKRLRLESQSTGTCGVNAPSAVDAINLLDSSMNPGGVQEWWERESTGRDKRGVNEGSGRTDGGASLQAG